MAVNLSDYMNYDPYLDSSRKEYEMRKRQEYEYRKMQAMQEAFSPPALPTMPAPAAPKKAKHLNPKLLIIKGA